MTVSVRLGDVQPVEIYIDLQGSSPDFLRMIWRFPNGHGILVVHSTVKTWIFVYWEASGDPNTRFQLQDISDRGGWHPLDRQTLETGINDAAGWTGIYAETR